MAPPAVAHVAWTLDPLQLGLVAVAALAYAQRAGRLARRGAGPGAWRALAFAAGLAVVVVALVSPIDAIGEEHLFSVHMLQHVLLGTVAPPLLLLGLTGPLLRPLLALPGVGRLRALAHPAVALPLWIATTAAWHVPALYEAALGDDAVHALEHMLFVATGLLLWAPVAEPLPAPAWFGDAARLGYLAAAWLAGVVLANVFFWAGAPLYPTYEHARPYWGLSALDDQRLAGAAMMLGMSAVVFPAVSWLFLRLLRRAEQRERLVEQGVSPARAVRAVRFGRGDRAV